MQGLDLHASAVSVDKVEAGREGGGQLDAIEPSGDLLAEVADEDVAAHGAERDEVLDRCATCPLGRPQPVHRLLHPIGASGVSAALRHADRTVPGAGVTPGKEKSGYRA
jgi:hypothetical protein